MNILVFEDQAVEQLRPITLARPAYNITCACFRLSDWMATVDGTVTGSVRRHLRELQSLDFPFLADSLDTNHDNTLLVSARVVPCQSNFEKLDALAKQQSGAPVETAKLVAVDQNGNACAMVAPTASLASSNAEEMPTAIAKLIAGLTTTDADNQLDVLHYPHDIVHFNQEHFNSNLEQLISTREFKQLQDGVFVGSYVDIAANISFDTSDGPIVFDDGSKVGPFSHIAGPIFSGKNCKILEHSAIKDFVCLTDTVKAGGEIEATVIEPYSNKQHHGFLGHSYLGSWINLGAGTCNSDLKNTYGKVNCNYGGEKVSTGMQFAGCFIGDYSKSAINTSIFTGKTIGVCSMLYGFVAQDVPSFVNYARTFEQVTQVPAEVMVTTQQRMFSRRKVEQRPADIQLLHDMFAITNAERDNQSIPTGNLSF